MTNNKHETKQSASELLAALQAILPYARNEIGFINLRNDGCEKDEVEAQKANAALSRAKAAIAQATSDSSRRPA